MPQPGFFKLFREQLNPPPLTRADLQDKTIIVVGANVGIGFEASKHFASMRPGKLILACRSREKGEAALAKIREDTGCGQTGEVWLIDLSDFASVTEFGKRIDRESLPRVDVVVLNAALSATALEFTVDGWEATHQVNYLASALLALLLVPRMTETAERYNTTPRLAVVGSGAQYLVKNLGKKAVMDGDNPLRWMGHRDHFARTKTFHGFRIYSKTKVLSHFFVRALNDRLLLTNTKPLIIVCTVDPGMCATSIARHYTDFYSHLIRLGHALVGRTAEEGSRVLVWAAVGGEENENEKENERRDAIRLGGAFVSTVAKVDMPSNYISSVKGRVAQDKLWDNLIAELGEVEPKVHQIVQEYLTQ